MVWRIASGLVLTLALEHVLGLDQVESSEDAMMLLQTQAKITKHTSLLEKEEAEDYMEDDAEEDEWEEVDAEQEMAEAAQWAGGYKRCWGSPRGAHSACKVVGGGKDFAASPRLCAKAAKDIGADTFQFLKKGAKCWLKKCKNINMQYNTEGRKRPWQIFSTFCGLERVHTEIESECGPGLFTNYLKFPAPPAETCAKALSFTGMKSNNLNGFGPGQGAEVFRFSNVLPDVDLIVKADESYRPANSDNNGVHKKFGRLNMAAGTEASMIFIFVQSTGQIPVKVDNFLFTVYDIDQGARCSSQMTVNASRYSAYYVDPETELIVKTDIGGTSWPASSSFTSSQKGNAKDNPRFPRRLSPTQSARAVTFEYQNTKFFRMGFKMGPGKGGRNILFGGISSLTEEFCPFNGHPKKNAGTDPEAAEAAGGKDR
jgi:hypothetical protein